MSSITIQLTSIELSDIVTFSTLPPNGVESAERVIRRVRAKGSGSQSSHVRLTKYQYKIASRGSSLRLKAVGGPRVVLMDTNNNLAYEYEVFEANAICADRCILCANNVEDHVTCFQVSGCKPLVCFLSAF